MLLRLLALLIALGLSASAVQASALTMPVEAALVDEAEDTSDAEAIAATVVAVTEARHLDTPRIATPPPLYRHQLLVFRPPRVPAFN